jgi:hypothetical protein
MTSNTKTVPAEDSIPRWNSRDASWYGTFLVIVACLGVLATVFLAGCSGSVGAHAVNEPQAREALKTALDQWKAGASVESMPSSATRMTVQDFDWAAGAKLVDFEIVDDGKAYDANLRVQVKLSLSSPGSTAGKATEKKVWFLVGTSPSVTVFRDALRR